MSPMTNTPDKRLTPARPDLAATHLRGVVDAGRYVDGTPMQAVVPFAAIRRTPGETGPQDTQLLFGEMFTVYDREGGWCWGQAALDDYVGYVAEAALSTVTTGNTHRVTTLATYRYREPDIKSPPLDRLPMNAKIQAGSDAGDKFVREARGGWVFTKHLKPIAESRHDVVATARQFLGVPYFWGGRSADGLDCSGLIQNVLERRGIPVPRDTDQQEQWCRDNGATEIFRRRNEREDWTGLALHPGDLLFWKGHVAMMVDTEDMIHANATAMAVSIDDAREFSGKVGTESGPVQAIYRI